MEAQTHLAAAMEVSVEEVEVEVEEAVPQEAAAAMEVSVEEVEVEAAAHLGLPILAVEAVEAVL